MAFYFGIGLLLNAIGLLFVSISTYVQGVQGIVVGGLLGIIGLICIVHGWVLFCRRIDEIHDVNENIQSLNSQLISTTNTLMKTLNSLIHISKDINSALNDIDGHVCDGFNGCGEMLEDILEKSRQFS